jgi:hypothetical protein
VRTRHALLSVIAAVSFLHARPARASDVTACEQVVGPGEIGVLQTDLDCAVNGVFLERGATLMLDGHELRGGSNIGVYCRKTRCAIEGPGTITGSDWIGVLMEDRVRLTVRNVVFRANEVGILGTYAGRNKVTLADVTFEDNGQWALSARNLIATNLVVRGNAPGGFYAIAASTARISGSNISDNLTVGIQGNTLRLDGVTVTGNTGAGIVATRRLRLVDSVATGNDAAAAGVDIRSDRRPHLVASTCGRSADENGVPWGVCTGD